MNTNGLLEWQPAPAQHIRQCLLKYGAAVDGSDTGVGKTAVALAIIRDLNVPTLVVGPRIGRYGWEEMAKILGPGAEFDYINYEKLTRGNTPYYKINPTTHEMDWAPEIKLLIFDEIHRCNGLNTLNAQCVIRATQQRIFRIGLSATLGQSPMDFKAIGFMLGLHALHDEKTGPNTVRPGFYRWARRLGCKPGVWGGYEFRGDDSSKRAVMGLINSKIFPDKGARVRKTDLGKAFPDIQITASLYDMGGEEKINALWGEMSEAMAALKERAADDKDPRHPMTKLLRAKEQLELLKVPTFVELAKDDLAQGYSVVFFVCFTSTLEELISRLDIRCRIDGSQVGEAGLQRRFRHIEAFQSNQEKVLAANIDAGGVNVSLHDLHGGHPRVGYLSLGYSAVKVIQALGRLHRAGAKSKALYRIPLAKGTLDERVHSAITPKLNRISALMDGKLDADNLTLTDSDLDANAN